MKKINLCTCNNCGYLLQDTNPQINAREFIINDDCNLLELKIIEDMKACPNCLTDEYLQDIEY